MNIFKAGLIGGWAFVFFLQGYLDGEEMIVPSVCIDYFSITENKSIISRITLDGLDVKGIRLSGDILVKGKLLKEKDRSVGGFLWKMVSEDLTLNGKGLPPIRAFFKMAQDELKIYYLSAGDSYTIKGRLSFKEKTEARLIIYLKNANLREIAIFMGIKRPDRVFGVISGILILKGPLQNMDIQGFIMAKGGMIGPIKYDKAEIKLYGSGPIIRIINGRIRQNAQRLTLEGYLDFRDLSKGALFDGLVVKSDMKEIMWEGWEISKDKPQELTIKKDIADNIKFSFKTIAPDPLPAYQRIGSDEEVTLEYVLENKERFNIKLRENEGFLGIEHKTKF